MNVTSAVKTGQKPPLYYWAIGLTVALLTREASAATTATNQPPAAATGTNAVTKLPQVIVTGRQDSLLGISDSASQGTTGQAQLADRPILRSGEILETVPGVIITQHAGGGKANQYFLRGFNLDHGTDFAVFLDDMPLNLPTHAHGEGYSDMNTVIPELVEKLDYEKGQYYAKVGDFGSAGAAHLDFYKVLPQDFVTLEAGTYGFERGVFGASQTLGNGSLLYGGEVFHDDGPWVHPDNYYKLNGLATYSQGNDVNGWSTTFRAYYGEWNSSDQIAASYGATNFFGAINPTDGGTSQRYSAQAEWHRADENSATKVTVYGFYYYLNLYSDFTYYLADPVLGDQFEQQDRRWVGGMDASHALFNEWAGREVVNTFGVQTREDYINNGLYQTDDRVRVAKTDTDTYDQITPTNPNGLFANGLTSTTLPLDTDVNRIWDTQVGIYAENKIQWSDQFRSVAAIRGDLDYFDVTSFSNPTNSGSAGMILPSPKLSLIFGPWARTELYVQGGFDFHSNDGRAATQTREPVSADFPNGGAVAKAAPLMQTRGGEIGVRTLALSHLQSTVSLWYLYSDSELLQDGDTGSTVASKSPSNRYGIEWGNYYKLNPNLALDLDAADSIARFVAVDAADAAPLNLSDPANLGPGGKHVPEAVGVVLSSGLTLHDYHGFSSSLRARYFGPRDLTSDGEYKSQHTLILNWEGSYRLSKTWSLTAEILNLLDSRGHDIDYAYESRVTPGGGAAFQNVFHPTEPIQARFGLTARF